MSRMWIASLLAAVMMLHGCGGSSADGSGGTPPPALDAQDDLLTREGVLPEFVNDRPSGSMDRVRHGSSLPTSSRIAAATLHSLALDDHGRPWAWGRNSVGQLGDGTTTQRLTPVAVDLPALEGARVVSVAAGLSHGLALDDQGRLWAWGGNGLGALGDGTGTNRYTPVAVDLSPLGGAEVVAVAAGHGYSLALDEQGRLWAWGTNLYGQLGDGTGTNQYTPVAVDLSGAAAYSAAAGGSHSLALDNQGRLWAWGPNAFGELGDGTTTERLTPVAVDLSALDGAAVVSVAAGDSHSLALDNQGRLWAWGGNGLGELGDGTTTQRLTPVAVDLSALEGAAVVSVAAGGFHSLALDDQGRLWAWGPNVFGELGDGTTTQRLTAVAVDLSALEGAAVVSVAAGGNHSLALDDQGRLWAWGMNFYGQVGDGTTTQRLTPVAVDL